MVEEFVLQNVDLIIDEKEARYDHCCILYFIYINGGLISFFNGALCDVFQLC